MPEADERHRGARACKINQRIVPAQRAEHHARHNVQHQNARGGKLGQVDEELDVYKRQMITMASESAQRIVEVLCEESALQSPENPVREVKDGSCLLYTSRCV